MNTRITPGFGTRKNNRSGASTFRKHCYSRRDFMEIGSYCLVRLPDRMRDEVGFILNKRPVTNSRWASEEYLVAHPFDVEWRASVKPLPPGIDTDVALCIPNPVATRWEDLPTEFTKPELVGRDRSYGWTYCGPEYGSLFPKP